MKDLGADAWMNAVMSALGAIACAVFVAIYHLRAYWWRSEVGRNQMAFAAAIGLLCLYTVLATIWQDDPCAMVVLRSIRTIAVAGVIVLMVQRTRLLLRAQRENRDRTGV
ncbi:putative phage holin [Streptomyces griseoluteus]